MREVPMQVSIPVASLHLGGGCRILAETANSLTRLGHRVSVVIPVHQPIDYELKCEVLRVPDLSPEHIPAADVVMANYYTTVLPAYRAAPTRTVRLSLGFEPLWSNDRQGTLETYLLPIPLMTISSWHRNVVRQHTGVDSTVVSPGLDLELFHASNLRSDRDRPVRVLYLVRDPATYPFKGWHDFEAAAGWALQRTRRAVEIRVVCPEVIPQTDAFKGVFLGRLTDEELAAEYRGCDIFVSSSWFESFGYPVLEAMASGALVVTTDAGGLRDFAKHGKSCLMVPPRDPEALGRALLEAIENGAPRKVRRIRSQAVHAAQEFTWARYARQVERVLQDVSARPPHPVVLDVMQGREVSNVQLGRLLAWADCWPHNTDLPLAQALSDLARKGAAIYARTSHGLAVSPQDVVERARAALRGRRAFCSISLGDTECAFLGTNLAVPEPYLNVPVEGFVNAGHDPRAAEHERRLLLDAIRSANVVGVPIYRHGVAQAPLLAALDDEGILLPSQRVCDSTALYRAAAEGALAPLLRAAAGVLCIGNEAERVGRMLEHAGVRVAGTIAPVQGLSDITRVLEEASRIRCDLVLVAAGTASVPLSASLAAKYGKVALDIGKIADEWATGFMSLDGSTWRSLAPDLTDRQRRLTLDVQVGYQAGLNKVMTMDERLPLGSFPHHWVRAAARHRRSEAEAKAIHDPVWLLTQIGAALEQAEGLSVICPSPFRWRQFQMPAFKADPDLRQAFHEADIIGLPYLEQPDLSRQIAASGLALPRRGWVERTAVSQLQLDQYGNTLPSLLRKRRILVISAMPNKEAAYLRALGYVVWGSVQSSAGPSPVLAELEASRHFDVALVNAGLYGAVYCVTIARRLGKVALDIGSMLQDAALPAMNSACWIGQPIRKVD